MPRSPMCGRGTTSTRLTGSGRTTARPTSGASPASRTSSAGRSRRRLTGVGASHSSPSSSIDAGLQNVTVDEDLTVSDLYGLATRLRSFDPSTVKTYRIDGQGVTIGGALVIQPDTTSSRARAILDYFRGESSGIERATSAEGSAGSTSVGSSSSTTATTAPRRSELDGLAVEHVVDDHGQHNDYARPRRPAARPGDRRHPPERPHLPLTRLMGGRIAGESPLTRSIGRRIAGESPAYAVRFPTPRRRRRGWPTAR